MVFVTFALAFAYYTQRDFHKPVKYLVKRFGVDRWCSVFNIHK